MDVSQENAHESLNQIQDATIRTRKAIASSYASGLLILWGLVWTIAFVGTHYFLSWVSHIWIALGVVGGIGTFLIFRRQLRSTTPTRISGTSKVGLRIFGLWILLFVYIVVWFSILRPESGLQINAFICTACMFAYIIIGLWFESYFMVWLGLTVTGITLVGLYLLPHGYYNLWMALFGGGAILGTGLYIRIFWN